MNQDILHLLTIFVGFVILIIYFKVTINRLRQDIIETNLHLTQQSIVLQEFKELAITNKRTGCPLPIEEIDIKEP